jgi:hypothetical protein
MKRKKTQTKNCTFLPPPISNRNHHAIRESLIIFSEIDKKKEQNCENPQRGRRKRSA